MTERTLDEVVEEISDRIVSGENVGFSMLCPEVVKLKKKGLLGDYGFCVNIGTLKHGIYLYCKRHYPPAVEARRKKRSLL